MAVQQFNIKDILKDQKKSTTFNNPQKKAKKDSGSMLNDLAQTGLTALPFVPKKYIAMGAGVIGVFLYGAGSLLYDIISLFI